MTAKRRLKSPIVMRTPSSKVATTVSSGRSGRGTCAHRGRARTRMLRSFIGGGLSLSCGPEHPGARAAAAGRRGSVGAGLAAIELETAAAFFQIGDGSLAGGIGDLDAVVHGDRAGGLREACGDAFVLN